MDEITEEADCYSILDDDHVFSQIGWSHVFSNRVNTTKWKDKECDYIKTLKMNYLMCWIKNVDCNKNCRR